MPECGTSAIEGSSGQSFRKFGIVNVSIEWDYADPRVIVLQNIQRERYAGRGGDGSRAWKCSSRFAISSACMSEVRRFVMPPLDFSKPSTEEQQRCLIAWYKRHGFLVVEQKTTAPLIWFRKTPPDRR